MQLLWYHSLFFWIVLLEKDIAEVQSQKIMILVLLRKGLMDSRAAAIASISAELESFPNLVGHVFWVGVLPPMMYADPAMLVLGLKEPSVKIGMKDSEFSDQEVGGM